MPGRWKWFVVHCRCCVRLCWPVLKIYLLTLLLLVGQPTFAENGRTPGRSTAVAYNEVYDETGAIRPHYLEAIKQVSGMSTAEVTAFIKESTRRMSGDTPVAPLPRILTESEYKVLKEGTQQRAKAIQMFLEDHYSGKQEYRDKVIPGEIIDMIVARTGEGPFVEAYSKMKKKDRHFRFLYGPDIIRDASGTWRVLEDNLGFVGGTPGDTIPSRLTWQSMSPELAEQLDIQNDPHKFLAKIMERMNKMAEPAIGPKKNDGVIVMLSSPPYGDKEDVRMAEEFARNGVILVTPNTANRGLGATSKELVVKPDGVYLKETSKYGGDRPLRKVGMLWLNSEHAWADWQSPVIREKALLEEARDYLDETGKPLKKPRELADGTVVTHQPGIKKETREAIEAAIRPDPKTGKIDVQNLEAVLRRAQDTDFAWVPSMVTDKSPYPGLLEAMMDGRVQSNYMPGAEFVGDKMLHSYMEDLIRHYLKEEPILKNPPTNRFFYQDASGELVFDMAELKKAMGEKGESVIKVVDGRGGDGIHIGPKMTLKQWKALSPTVRKEFLRYVNQQYMHPSVIEDGHNMYIADLRMFSYISEEGRLVSTTPWGRSTVIMRDGKKINDDGKVNMSTGNGTLTVVMVVPDCKKSMAEIVIPAAKAVQKATLLFLPTILGGELLNELAAPPR